MRPKKAAFLTKAHGKPKAAPGVICHLKGRSKAEDGAAVDRSRKAWPPAHHHWDDHIRRLTASAETRNSDPFLPFAGMPQAAFCGSVGCAAMVLSCQRRAIEESFARIGGHPAKSFYRQNKPQGIAMKSSINLRRAALAIAFCNAFATLASPSHAQPVWPTEQGANVTTSSESIPLFPQTLSGFISEPGQDFWGKSFRSRGTMRIFQREGWQGIPDFPNSSNGCSSGEFMIRWRSANPDVRIQSSARNSGAINESVETGMFGYMSGTNCEQPMFKFGNTINNNEANLVDIYYELKFWQATP